MRFPSGQSFAHKDLEGSCWPVDRSSTHSSSLVVKHQLKIHASMIEEPIDQHELTTVANTGTYVCKKPTHALVLPRAWHALQVAFIFGQALRAGSRLGFP
ncbi:hypothetical protein D9M72_442990 [compost metagenome]